MGEVRLSGGPGASGAQPRWAWWVVGIAVPIAAVVLGFVLTHMSGSAASPPPAGDSPAQANPTTSPLPGTSARPAVTVVGSYQGLQLGDGNGVDLGTSPPSPSQYGGDVRFEARFGTNPALIYGSEMTIFPPGSSLSYTDCKDATRQEDQINVDEELVAGSKICVTSEHSRIALLTVAHMPDDNTDSGDYISFDATVWQGTPG